jgi:coenzyme F420-0:L-glutamate ligase/coenzyme F420-1:gamma-L-glutamate ligase
MSSTAWARAPFGAGDHIEAELRDINVIPVLGLPEVQAGDGLGDLIAVAASLEAGDIVVISQKVVSKAEGQVRDLDKIRPGAEALELAARLAKDPALVQLVLDQSTRVVRAERDVLIAETRHGWVCANAGIDGSNVPGERTVTLLPEDADASARRVRAELGAACGFRPAVVISDSFGRPWRLGQCDIAVGCAGLAPLDDWRGRRDRDGQRLVATAIAVADQIAAAADLARDKAAGIPVSIVRGLERLVTGEDGPGAAALVRPPEQDLFR